MAISLNTLQRCNRKRLNSYLLWLIRYFVMFSKSESVKKDQPILTLSFIYFFDYEWIKDRHLFYRVFFFTLLHHLWTSVKPSQVYWLHAVPSPAVEPHTPPRIWGFDQHTLHILPMIISLPSPAFGPLLAAAGTPLVTQNPLRQGWANKNVKNCACTADFQSWDSLPSIGFSSSWHMHF